MNTRPHICEHSEGGRGPRKTVPFFVSKEEHHLCSSFISLLCYTIPRALCNRAMYLSVTFLFPTHHCMAHPHMLFLVQGANLQSVSANVQGALLFLC